MDMEWERGELLGRGSFASVNIAKPRKGFEFGGSTTMAVKSCEDCSSSTLKNEKSVLDQIGYCPEIVDCFGDGFSYENGERLYNLFLEYASRGCLADLVKKTNGGLRESDVKRYTRSILKGLSHVHSKGFVHCDLKLQNVLIFDDGDVKIADFGLAKRAGKEKQSSNKWGCRGTPLYLSPEAVNENEYESQGDIWALGCAIVEMVTGKSAWNHCIDSNVFALMVRIGVGDELPLIPQQLSEQGKDFLMRCLVKDPIQRWTADMLLNHPFVSSDTVQFHSCEEDVVIKESSPRSPFGFPDWVSINSNSFESVSNSAMDRIRNLAGNFRPDWLLDEEDCWVTVR